MAEVTHSTRAVVSSVASHAHLSAFSAKDPAFLATLTINELDALYEACVAAADAFIGVCNQPRVESQTPLETVLCEMAEEAENHCTAIMEAMAAATSKDWYERRQRAHRMIAHACRCGENIPDIRDLAGDLIPSTSGKEFS